VTWSLTGISPAINQSGCSPANVSSPGSTTLTCTATSAGGNGSGSVTIKLDTTPPTTPAISGIAAQSYTFGSVPPSSGISCTASDPESGLGSCTVSGYSASGGQQTITATATDGAGLTSTSQLSYTVTPTTTTTTLAASKPSAVMGAPVTLTATVAPA